MEKNIQEMIEYPEEGIISKKIIKTEKLDSTLFCMAKSMEISNHTTAKEGFVYVIEGKGIFNLKGNEIKMLPGILIPLDKGVLHSLKAEENTSFLLNLV